MEHHTAREMRRGQTNRHGPFELCEQGNEQRVHRLLHQFLVRGRGAERDALIRNGHGPVVEDWDGDGNGRSNARKLVRLSETTGR